ncbi:MAG TPA: PEP-utilizing enzyme [Solirubrobacteraceae bacterium]|nr:PEP-utilizing enzyme [Solirubrobacteraceae bacterium]
MTAITKRSFPSPLDVRSPAGAEGWQKMYPPYLLFSAENSEWESAQFWYWDGMHRPDVEYPFDTLVHEAYMMSVSAVVSRVFAIPGAKSAASRVLNGRLYLADIPFTEEAEEVRRLPEFARRAGHYFENWEQLNANWKAKVAALTDELAAIRVPELPDLEDETVVTSGRGFSSAHVLLDSFARAVANLFLVYQYHFEMLVLAYVAQLNLHELARAELPGLTQHALARFTGGVELEQFRPDEELKRLARLALELGVSGELRAGGTVGEVMARLERHPKGREWLTAMEQVKDPWFFVSTGTGLFHHERSWIDDLSVPIAAIGGYIERLERGEAIDRPRSELLAQRDRVTDQYRALLPEDRRVAFDEALKLARLVAPHMQDHNFYIEHRHHTIFWNKMRLFADRVVDAGLLDTQEDFFYLNRWEAGQVLFDTANSWAQASPGLRMRWRSLVCERREILDALRSWVPEPAVGAVPTHLGGLLTAQFGITMDTVQRWLDGDENLDVDELTGTGASPGVVEGPARVVLSTDEIDRVADGEILVCTATAPSWAPVFGKVRATVSDVGGMMSHAAILCREYQIPAVLGTGAATRLIQTGDLVRVDGDRGSVRILRRAA